MTASIPKRLFGIAGLMLLALAGAPAAHAHAQSTSYLELETRDSGPVPVRWDLSVHDLIWSVFIDADFDGAVSPQELAAARQRYLVPGVLSQVSLRRGGAHCTVNVRDAVLSTRQNESFISIAMRAHCLQPGLLEIGGNLYRLGEGSGAVLALSLVQSAARLMSEMRTFEEANLERPTDPRDAGSSSTR